MFRRQKIVSAIILGVCITQILASYMFGTSGFKKVEAAEEQSVEGNSRYVSK